MNTRKEAIAAGVGTYTTGKPCKYGHLSYRYTQSGSCAQCVAESASVGRELLNKHKREYRELTVAKKTAALQPILAARHARDEALKALEPIKVLAHPQDVSIVFDTAIELCLAAFPILDRADVTPPRTPIKGNPVYRVHVPPDQVEFMHQVANALYVAHGANVSSMADKVARMVQEQADREASPAPEGWS